MEQLIFDNSTSNQCQLKARCMSEFEWIKRLQSAYPLGLNDNILNVGTISKNKSINSFSLFSKRLRNKRSHGIRKNGNIRRKFKRLLSLNDCYTLLQNGGKHKLLSALCSLSVSSLAHIVKECKLILIQSDPLYECACIIESFTDYYLKPFIENVLNKTRNRIKIEFCNKGLDLIDLPKIFNDKNVRRLIPPYFRNTESPLICYKYSKPVRSIVFNYNSISTDINVIRNCPTSCDCSSSKYLYGPVGHVITGDLNFIQNKNLRNLLRRGPKYRLPIPVDFDDCIKKLVTFLHEYCAKWCSKENAEITALNDWKAKVFSMAMNKIYFYDTNPLALPHSPKFNKQNLCKLLEDLKSKFVIVPADKAANNVIII